MVAHNRNHPGSIVRDRHLDFVKINWCLLCTVAYSGFLKNGRGMTIACDEDYMNKPKGILTRLRISFIPSGELTARGVIGDKEIKWMAEYQPERTLLVGFVRQDGGFSSYRLDSFGDNTPLEIYNRSKPSDSQHPDPQT